MKTKRLSAFCRQWFIAASFLMPFFLFGCATEQKPAVPLEQPVDLNTTIGNLAELYQFNAVEVRGFGIAAGLNGTGSSECPPALRTELEKYIRQQLPKTDGLSPRQFLDSPNTAVVEINGTIPRLAERKETFDLLVSPIDRTTTSLDGGYVYTAPLKERSTFVRYDQYAKTFASAHGQLFRNKLDQENASNWYLLGGGTVENEASVSLVLRKPSFQAANVIRNRLNERFGPDTAAAVSSSEISLKIPARYREQKERFLSLVYGYYLLMDEEAAVERHIEGLLDKLKNETNKTDAEIGLEAVGKRVLTRLSPLLSSADEKIRFHAARCMLNLGDEEALPVMEAFSKAPNSPYCLAALETIGLTVRPRKSEPILLRAVSSDLPDVRLAAYRQLERIQSSSISRNLVADSFVVDRVFCSGRPLIFVFRSEAPKIVLFGSPIHCKPDVFLQSDETGILLNAKPEDKMIAVSRRHPKRPRLIGPIYSNRELSALIRTLGESADPSYNPKKQPGLAVPYQDIILLLKQLADNKMVDADFLAGPMTQAGSFLQKTTQNDR